MDMSPSAQLQNCVTAGQSSEHEAFWGLERNGCKKMNDNENRTFKPIPRTQQSAPVERRKKNRVPTIVSTISVIGWILGVGVLLFLERAQPGKENFLTRITNAVIRTTYNAQLLRVSFGLLLGVLVTCLTGIIYNAMRMRRKTDKYNKSVIILGGIAAVGFVLFLWRFWGYLF